MPFHKNYSDLIGAKIKINDLKELPKPIAVDLIRNSIIVSSNLPYH